MVDTRNPVKMTIEKTLAQDKWLKKSGDWNKEKTETFLILNIQKSNYSRKYFLNLSVALKNEVGLPPRFSDAEVSTRLELIEGSRQYLELLDLESDIPEGHRVAKLEEMMHSFVLPLMNSCDTVLSMMPGGPGHALVRDALLLKSVRYLAPDSE